MPRATVSMEPKLEELKSAPPDGFIKMRRMSYGELMTSQDLAYQVQMKADEQDPENPEMGVTLSRIAVAEYQIRTCIMDHNLEDENGRKLDFRTARDIHLLDSAVGQEVMQHIDDYHNVNKQFPNSEKSSLNGFSTENTGMTEARARTPEVVDVVETSVPGSKLSQTS